MKRILIPLVSVLILTACTTKASSSFPTVTVGELKTVLDSGAYLLDVRTPAEFAEGHIASAINLPLDQVEARANEVPADRPVYVICRSGNRSAQASAILSKVGRDVRNVGGGMNDWITAGYPVTR
ncbi:rhodanese-like domain-containing protein [Deinococcus arenicola]|uniref:Rhodanese-like domain-containing protein n=1 Tax=Deinococcus arenicola TaxID=2994950 RepID=A0ABU4DXY4_9DEIO|nr:rhodanese-like domain-containing protein [Deinococcus sp. ZS9-10]MDV6376549.1 rhodanese-like domain-containing protein [Deinococcus sp. ZS9-10]